MRPVVVERTSVVSVCHSCEKKARDLFFVQYQDNKFFFVCDNCLPEGE